MYAEPRIDRANACPSRVQLTSPDPSIPHTRCCDGSAIEACGTGTIGNQRASDRIQNTTIQPGLTEASEFRPQTILHRAVPRGNSTI